jgi:hypothetical protein
LAQDADHSLCSVSPIQPPVEHWATLNDARLGKWGAVLYCRRTLEALKRSTPCLPPVELDVLSLAASFGHWQPLDRLPAKLRCPGCESHLISVEWIVPSKPAPDGAAGKVAAPVPLRPTRLVKAEQRFRVIEGRRKRS